jgi:chemotaxis protein methyltransferase CheR
MANEVKLHSKVRDLLYKLTGITLADNKELMITNRLQKLRTKVGYNGDLEHLLTAIERGEYQTEFINSFTTNKTHFFRELFHFDDMKDRALPEIFQKQNSVSIYCSASSTGEEPYSIAMTLLTAQKENNKRNMNSSIVATDIDTDVLHFARNGVYRFRTSNKDFPAWAHPRDFFKRRADSKNESEFLIKVKDEVKRLLEFKQMNLSDSSYPFRDGEFDIVFCRNVLIYFNQDDQNKILKRLFKVLKMGGTLYLGHSENPLDLAPYVKRMGQNIFVKTRELH